MYVVVILSKKKERERWLKNQDRKTMGYIYDGSIGVKKKKIYSLLTQGASIFFFFFEAFWLILNPVYTASSVIIYILLLVFLKPLLLKGVTKGWD